MTPTPTHSIAVTQRERIEGRCQPLPSPRAMPGCCCWWWCSLSSVAAHRGEVSITVRFWHGHVTRADIYSTTDTLYNLINCCTAGRETSFVSRLHHIQQQEPMTARYNHNISLDSYVTGHVKSLWQNDVVGYSSCIPQSWFLTCKYRWMTAVVSLPFYSPEILCFWYNARIPVEIRS